MSKIEDGCELCGDFPVQLQGRCHPTAPLRVLFHENGELELRCYLPECNRLITTFQLEEPRDG